jgi:hypothetical protein
MEGSSFLREGCFCQLGRERMEKSWDGRSGGSGWTWSAGREAMEEKGLRRRTKWKWRRGSPGAIMAAGFLILAHRTAVRNPFMNVEWLCAAMVLGAFGCIRKWSVAATRRRQRSMTVAFPDKI